MYGSTRVSLSLDELIALKVALRGEIAQLDKLIEFAGDPTGTRAEDRDMAQGLYEKLDRASVRAKRLIAEKRTYQRLVAEGRA